MYNRSPTKMIPTMVTTTVVLKYHYFFQTWWVNWTTHLKKYDMSQIGSFSPIFGVKITKIWFESWNHLLGQIHPLVIPIPSPTSSGDPIRNLRPALGIASEAPGIILKVIPHSESWGTCLFFSFFEWRCFRKRKNMEKNLTVAWTFFFFFASFFFFSEATWGCWDTFVTFVNFISWVSYPKSSEFSDVMRIRLVLPSKSARKITNLGKIWLSCKSN